MGVKIKSNRSKPISNGDKKQIRVLKMYILNKRLKRFYRLKEIRRNNK